MSSIVMITRVHHDVKGSCVAIASLNNPLHQKQKCSDEEGCNMQFFFFFLKTFKARKIGKSTSPDFDWISSLADLVESFLSNGTSKDSCAGCSVSGLFVGVVGNILNELGANVLILVLQVDGLSYCHSIFRNLRAPPTLFNYDIPSLQIKDISNLCLFC